MERLSKEFKLNISNNISVKYGSVDKNNPKVIYIEGKCWVSPLFEGNYTAHIDNIKAQFRKCVSKLLISNEVYSSKFILDFDVNTENMKIDEKKFLSFNIFLRQESNSLYALKDSKLYEHFPTMVNMLYNLLNENEFRVTKRK
jgi:hypothetical protein